MGRIGILQPGPQFASMRPAGRRGGPDRLESEAQAFHERTVSLELRTCRLATRSLQNGFELIVHGLTEPFQFLNAALPDP